MGSGQQSSWKQIRAQSLGFAIALGLGLSIGTVWMSRLLDPIESALQQVILYQDKLPLDSSVFVQVHRLRLLRTAFLVSGLSASWLLALTLLLGQFFPVRFKQRHSAQPLPPAETDSSKERLLQVHQQLLEMIATGASLQAVLDGLAETAEAHFREMFCSISLLEPDGLHLQQGTAPRLPNDYSPIDEFFLASRLSPCGAAAFPSQTVIVSDIATDPRWPELQDLALSHPLRACWSTPILSNKNSNKNQVLGMVALYCPEPRSPALEDIELLNTISHLAGIAIEQRQSEAELQQREAHIRAIFEAEPECVKLMTAEGILLEINAAGLSMLEAEQAEAVIGQSVYPLITPEYRDRFKAFNQYICAGNRGSLEFELISYQGKRRWMETHAVPLRNPTDGSIAHLAITRDITQRKQIEAALRESEERWQLALRGNNDGIWDWNLKTNEVFHSSRWKSMLGYTDDDLLNCLNAWSERVHPDDLDRVTQKVQAHLQQQTSFYISEHRMRCKDGSYRWILDRGQALWDEQGTPIRMVGSHTDITERKQAEEDLRQQKELLQTIFDHVPVMLTFFNSEGRMIRSNREWEKVMSWKLEELPEDIDLLKEFYPDPTDRQEAIRFIAAADKQWRDFKTQIRTGEVIDTTWANLRLSDGSTIGIGQDITHRKQAEAALQHQADQSRLVTEITQHIRQSLQLEDVLNTAVLEVRKFLQCDRVLIYRFQEDWSGQVVVESVEPQYPTILGTTIADSFFKNGIVRQSYAQGQIMAEPDVYKAQLSPCHLTLLETFQIRANLVVPILQEEALWGLLVANQCAEPRQWQLHEIDLLRQLATQLEIAIHQSQLFRQVQAELHERERAEQKIREQAALLDVATDAILVRDLNHHILYWNKGAEQLYGWRAEEAIGRIVSELLYQHSSSLPPEVYQILLERGEWRGELQHVTKNGQDITVESRWTLVQAASGQPKAVLMVNTDITQKKLLERQFLRSQRMESIGTLAGGIAHDLNNILAPILMSIELLRIKLGDDQSQQWLEVLETSARRGSDLIKQVLSFARGLEGEQGILQVRHLINEVKQIVEETFPRSIRIVTNISQELWTVCGDATHLHQVLMNLCVNARDAMPQGGTLTIEAANLEIDEEVARSNLDAQPGMYTTITVADTGAGIPSDLLDRIFEPFFTTKEVGKGTGLGLSTVLAIVRSHRGFILVSSQQNIGTQFQVFLPAVVQAEGVLEEVPDLSVGRGEWILLVDDEASIRQITKDTLQTYNYHVLTASDGIEAIAVFAQHQDKIRAVLIDMMMPSLDGATTIRTLQKFKPGVPIVASSGMISSDSLNHRIDENIPFLAKPYSTEALLTTLHRMLHP
ncbi:MAG TPA: PAS domain S-box protein [Trichocoleus sp.]|jgi:PAS domain S-box-containing protein